MADVQELTRRHDETIARLELQEAREKRTRWTAVLSVLGALGAGGGGGLAYLDRGSDTDTMETVVAKHIALADSREASLATELKHLDRQQQAIRDAVIRLQVTVEGLSKTPSRRAPSRQVQAGLVEVNKLLAEIKREKRSEKPISVSSAEVQGVRELLFQQLK